MSKPDKLNKADKIEIGLFLVFLLFSLIALGFMMVVNYRHSTKCKVSAQPDLREHCKQIEEAQHGE
jgi:hypothetical protein